MISQEDFEEAYWYVEEHRTQELAYFDYLFGMAMYYYSKHDVDYVVMETGLGGKLDATNAVDNPVVSVITTISLEHTAILGDTIEKIANEKAGIIKPGIPVVCSGIVKEAADVIRKRAADFGCDCHVVDDNTFELIQNTYGYIDFLIHNEYYKNDCFTITTGAVYQVQNCSLALTAAEVLKKTGVVKLESNAVHKAVKKVQWHGRMEQIADNIYVDGAHNPEGIEALICSVSPITCGRKTILLFSVVNDKDYDRMIKSICDSNMFDYFVIAGIQGKRCLDDRCISDTFKKYTDKPVMDKINIKDAYESAAALRRDIYGVLFCTGSLYLVGEIMSIIK